jgi:hypothetical protein
MSARASLNPVRVWNRFWFAPCSARSLAVFRVVFGLIVLAHLALLWPDAPLWLSEVGYLRGTEARELAGPLRWSPLQISQDPRAVGLVMGVTALVAIGFTVGTWTRICAVIQYAGLLTIHHRNLLTISGVDALLMITAFWMMLAPAGAVWSLDERRRRRTSGVIAERLIAPWAQRMIQMQLCVVYFMTAFEKTRGASWADGTALYHVLSNREVRRWTFGLTEHLTLINAMTFGTVILEFALAFLLWFRATRAWIAMTGVLLHVGIMLTVNIPLFGELMMATYLLFLTPEELSVLGPAFRLWRRRQPAQAGEIRELAPALGRGADGRGWARPSVNRPRRHERPATVRSDSTSQSSIF